MFDVISVFLRRLFRRNQFERELTEELGFHLDARVEDLVGRGLDPKEARRRAQIEIGVRVAMGATRAGILALVLRRGAWLVVIGVAAGIAASYPGTRLVRHLLFDTVPLDPAAYAGAVLVLGAVAATASLVPALGATRVDPAVVLRGE